MALADVVHETQEPAAKIYCQETFNYFSERLDALGQQCIEELKKQGFNDDNIQLDRYLHLRYDGTDCALMCNSAPSNSATRHGDFLKSFIDRYQTEFGFTIRGRDVIVDDIRVRGIGKSLTETDLERPVVDDEAKAEEIVKTYFEGGFHDTKVYLLRNLSPGHILKGPSIIIDELSTILVEPDCTAIITKRGDIKITIGSGKIKNIGPELDSIQLSIFSHRFMSIAEQMGRLVSFMLDLFCLLAEFCLESCNELQSLPTSKNV